MARVLIVEDDKEIGDLIILLLEGTGHDVELATSGAAALDMLARSNHEVVFTDIHMKPMNGLDLIAKVKERHPGSVFVFITGDDDPDLQERGLKLGALEFLHKPIRVQEFKQVLNRALNRIAKDRTGPPAGATVPVPAPAPLRTVESIAHELEAFYPGKALGPIRKQLAQFATANRHALIETPAGMLSSEMLRFLHGLSEFSAGPLVVRNAAEEPIASVEELLASAEGGLLALLNLETIPIRLQHVLAAQLRHADKLRVITTTPEDPDKLMVEGKLIGSLYSRLALCALRLPPLSEMEADIPGILVAALTGIPTCPFGKTPVEIDATAAHALRTYAWPEDITELWSVANRAAAHMKEPRLTLAQLPERISGARLPRLEQYLREAEAQHVQRVLRVLRGVPQAAEALGVSEAELEAYRVQAAAEPFFVLKRDMPPPLPPSPVVERLLLVAGDETIRHTAVVTLMAKELEIIAVADGLAAIAAVLLSTRPFAAAVLIPPLAVLEVEELGAQLARLAPHVRLGLLGGRPGTAESAPFQVAVPAFRTGADVEGLVEELLHASVVRPTT